MADAPPEEEAKADKGARALECQQDNPKRDQSKSWKRYEAYKSATTVAEFLSKGGTPADLAHDVGKGFVWYLDEGPHINPVAKRERKPAVEKPKKAQKVPLAKDDPWSAWNDDDLDDVCDACGRSTLTESGQPMPNVLICEVCEAERHLECSGLSDPPEGDYVCPECSERKRPAKKAPRSDDVSARARQLSARCIKCGQAGESQRELYFCEVAGCYGAWHGDCFEYHPSESHQLIKCPQCRDQVPLSPAPSDFWRVQYPEDMDLAERGRLHQILMDQAQSLPRGLQDDFLAGYGCVLPKDDRKRKAAVLIPAPSQRYWPVQPVQQARAIGGGWWAKPDVSSGREYYVHETTGECTWDPPT
jgi:hypothetical protein